MRRRRRPRLPPPLSPPKSPLAVPRRRSARLLPRAQQSPRPHLQQRRQSVRPPRLPQRASPSVRRTRSSVAALAPSPSLLGRPAPRRRAATSQMMHSVERGRRRTTRPSHCWPAARQAWTPSLWAAVGYRQRAASCFSANCARFSRRRSFLLRRCCQAAQARSNPAGSRARQVRVLAPRSRSSPISWHQRTRSLRSFGTTSSTQPLVAQPPT
mmetsp:Transcript_39398/g.103967  ORF Transcript_39398/g.103967 Transcript_39398/m.103967 type:complete len:212 (+) Transcript_39398:252-887(+)